MAHLPGTGPERPDTKHPRPAGVGGSAPGSPCPPDCAEGGREGSARRRRRKAGLLSPRGAQRRPGPRRPPLRWPEEQQACGAAVRSPARPRSPPRARPPAQPPRREVPAAASARAAGLDACAGMGASASAPAAPGACPGKGRTNLGGSPGSLAAEPRLTLRREAAASPAAGGGCTGTRRSGGGARRPGPWSRGPSRGGHLEARRRSRGTTGGGSDGDRSSST